MKFRDMRRSAQHLPEDETLAILREGSFGTLAVLGDEGYPYAVPLSYVYEDGRIYFHCATSGHKLDAIAACPKVSFCVVGQDDVQPLEYTTHFRSVIAFGQARILADEADKRRALMLLAEKYSPGQTAMSAEKIDRQSHITGIVEIAVEHLTGKESRALAQARKEQK